GRAPRCWRCRSRRRASSPQRGEGWRERRPPCCRGSPGSRAQRTRATRSRARSRARPRRACARHRASTRRRCRAAWPTRAPRRSPREAYPRRVREVELAHALGTERDELLARCGRVRDERGDVDRLARRRERAQTLDAFFEQDRRAVEVAAAPVMETDADLKDAVIEVAYGRGRVPPQQLERFMLLEKLSGVELLDAAKERFGWRF